MNHLLARKKSFREKQSDAGSAAPSSTTPSDQKPREAKSSPYACPSYETALATKGSFMGKFELGVTGGGGGLCRALLGAGRSVPQGALFRDDLFEETCESVRASNEAMVVRGISPLICPSAQVLRIYGAKHLKPLNESVDEGGIVLYLVTVLVHNLITLWGLDDLHSRTSNSKSLRLSLARLQIFYILFHGHLADVSPVPNVRSELRRRGFQYCRSTEFSQHDTCSERYGRTLQTYETRKGASPREVLAFSISHDHENSKNLRPLSCD